MAYKNPPAKRRFGQPEGNKQGTRPKGIPSRSTIARQVLKMIGEPPEAILKYFQKYYPNYVEKRGVEWTNEFLGYMRLMLNTIAKGDVRAFELILDSAYGKQGGDIVLGDKIGIDTTVVQMTSIQRDERIRELIGKLKKQGLIVNGIETGEENKNERARKRRASSTT